MNYTYLDFLALFGVGGAHPGGLKLTKQLLAEEKVTKQTSLLDVGCGTGQTSAYIAHHYGCSVHALDCNEIVVEKAQQRFSTLKLPIDVKVGDTESLPYPDASFDMIISESVTSFTNIAATIPEFKRTLRPNGVLLAIETVLEQPISDEEKNQIMIFYRFPQLLTEAEWHTAFTQAGFKQIEMTTYQPSTDPTDEQHAADFTLSADLDDELIDIMEEHEEITRRYEGKIGYRVFRCS
jgi:ubiquinone/menaquinone biosynthesis C-methylase UbiE